MEPLQMDCTSLYPVQTTCTPRYAHLPRIRRGFSFVSLQRIRRRFHGNRCLSIPKARTSYRKIPCIRALGTCTTLHVSKALPVFGLGSLDASTTFANMLRHIMGHSCGPREKPALTNSAAIHNLIAVSRLYLCTSPTTIMFTLISSTM